MNKTIVLFDLGNVLVSIMPGAFTRHLGIDPATAYRKYQKRILGIVRKYEGGGETTEAYLEHMSRLFDGRFEQSLIREAMLKVVGAPIEGMEELVGRVASKHETGLVSNTNELHFNHCRKTISAFRHFSRFYLSYELLSLKPSETYYRAVLKDLGASPSSVVFVDDMEENVLGARKSGMTALQFVSRSQLEKDFQTLSIL